MAHKSGKNLINWNRLKKFMQVGVVLLCMYTNFGGRGFSSFRDIATFKNSQISLSEHAWHEVLIINFIHYKDNNERRLLKATYIR